MIVQQTTHVQMEGRVVQMEKSTHAHVPQTFSLEWTVKNVIILIYFLNLFPGFLKVKDDIGCFTFEKKINT